MAVKDVIRGHDPVAFKRLKRRIKKYDASGRWLRQYDYYNVV